MRRHSNPAWLMLACLACLVVSGCAYNPRVINETESVLSIRADYLRANPDGEFNAHIIKGEVVKGMNFMEVLASWGLPDSRMNKKENELEYWGYFARDDESLDWILYTFTFEKTALVEWDATRHVAKAQTLTHWHTRETIDWPKVTDIRRDPDTWALRK